MDCCAGVNAALFPAVKGTVCRRASESRFVAEGAIVAMRQSFFSLAILASIFPGPALAQFKSWSKEQRTFERFSGALVSALHGGCGSKCTSCSQLTENRCEASPIYELAPGARGSKAKYLKCVEGGKYECQAAVRCSMGGGGCRGGGPVAYIRTSRQSGKYKETDDGEGEKRRPRKEWWEDQDSPSAMREALLQSVGAAAE